MVKVDRESSLGLNPKQRTIGKQGMLRAGEQSSPGRAHQSVIQHHMVSSESINKSNSTQTEWAVWIDNHNNEKRRHECETEQGRVCKRVQREETKGGNDVIVL